MEQLHDAVYFVKNCCVNEELRFSLRTVDANFPVRMVWLYGDSPNGIRPDGFVAVAQRGPTKWANTTGMLRMICENDDITYNEIFRGHAL